MAVQVLSLANGQLNTGTPSIYTSPTSPTALTTIVRSIRLVNTDTATRTVNLYFQLSGGTARRISPVSMSLAPGAMAIDDQEITMGPGDQILGGADLQNKVDYVISGIQR